MSKRTISNKIISHKLEACEKIFLAHYLVNSQTRIKVISSFSRNYFKYLEELNKVLPSKLTTRDKQNL